MNVSRRASLLCVPLLSWAMAQHVDAQVSRPTPEEARISAYDVPGGGGFKSKGLSEQPGLADPRDFTGTWDNEGNAAGFLALRARQAAEARSGGNGTAASTPLPGGAPPASGAALQQLRQQQGGKVSCMPAVGPFSGGDGPVEILQTADQLTWMAEEMHAIRRIFLKGTFTPGLAPTYNGESIGHFEGDTLVIETRSMKGLADGVHMLERMTKSEQGRVLEDVVRFVDAQGRDAGPGRTLKLFYRPNERMLEWICEDYGQRYQPGGYDREL